MGLKNTDASPSESTSALHLCSRNAVAEDPQPSPDPVLKEKKVVDTLMREDKRVRLHGECFWSRCCGCSKSSQGLIGEITLII